MIKKTGESLIAFHFVAAAEFFIISHNSFFVGLKAWTRR